MLKNISLGPMIEILDEHAIVSVADVSGNITYVNQLFIAISGYSEAELLGKNHRLLESGLHPHAFYQEMWDTVLSGKSWHGEVCNRSKSGELYWVRASIKPILDANELPIQYISIRTDITKIKQAEENANRSQQLMKAVMNSIPDLILYKDTEGKYVGCNQPFEKWAGINEAQLIGKTDFDFMEEKLATIRREQDEEVIVTNKPSWNEEWISYPDGREALMEVSKSPYHFGSELSGVIGISHDITLRKQAEDSIKASNLRWKFALEGSGDGVWDWNVQDGTVFFSTRWKEMLGYSENEIGNALAECENLYHPDDKWLSP